MGNCCKKKSKKDSLLDDPEANGGFIENKDDNPLGIKLKISDFTKIKVLGRGAFGQVFLVKLNANDKLYAMKTLDKKKVRLGNQEIPTKVERDLMVKVNCPFIVNIKFAFQDSDNLYITTEFMQGGDMFFHMHKEKDRNKIMSCGNFSEEKTRFYIVELICAIEFLHKNKMLYRDLKPENIMVDVSGHIKLTDFGLSKIIQKDKEKAYTICGTPKYLAPEILSSEGYDDAVDWWSLGCVMYEMMVGIVPFRLPKGAQLSEDLYKKKVVFPDFISPDAKDLISQLLVVKPKKRLGYGPDGAEKIKGHAWFKGINWEKAWKQELNPPYVPEIKDEMDLSYFDKIFTDERVDQSNDSDFSTSVNTEYNGFTYVTNSVSNELMDLSKNP